MDIKQLLDNEVKNRNCKDELCLEKPDPLYVAKKYNDEYISLICALFAYGNAGQIIKFLSSLDFTLLEKDEDIIKKELDGYYYRFQNSEDIKAFFIALSRMKKTSSLEDVFYSGYKNNNDILEGIDKIIHTVLESYEYKSDGYKFLLSTPLKRDKNNKIKHMGNAPYKRYNMFLRWMVRYDNLDMGLWKKVDKKDLILPLDTHTFKVSQRLGLLQRKTYDLKSAVLVTEKLKEFDSKDPIKYDFAIYRLGQEKVM